MKKSKNISINNPVSLPEITFTDFQGRHNFDLAKSAERLKTANSYKDLSTICIVPNNGLIAACVAEKWLGQVSQMNQKLIRLMAIGIEKYTAFNTTIEQILATPGLNTFKYILTFEEDVVPPFDALIKLFENIEKYDVIGALSWTKGIEGKPMLYGHPKMIPQVFTPFPPSPETVQECLGVGTSFTLFKLDIFKDIKIPKPWFRTKTYNLTSKANIDRPDLSFFENIHKLGYKVACDTRVRIGRYDAENDIVW